MVADPVATPLTTPLLTVATAVLLDFQVTDLSVASEGDTVAFRTADDPFSMDKAETSSSTPVTLTMGAFTVTTQTAVLAPSFVVTVIVAVPGPTAVTTPVEDTLATAVLLDFQLTDLSVALLGATVAFSADLSPVSRVSLDVFNVTPETGTTGLETVTLQMSEKFPSTVVA